MAAIFKLSRISLASLLALLFALPPSALAQSHVVSPADLQQQMVAASHAREKNIQKVSEFMSTELAVKAIKSVHADPAQVQRAISRLSDQELAQLAAKTDKAQRDFAAGSIGPGAITIIVLGVLVIILIVVVAS
jgi:hypothetical protein